MRSNAVMAVVVALAGLVLRADASVLFAQSLGNSMVLSTRGGILWGNLTASDAGATTISVALNGVNFPYVALSAESD
jgi:hypothetical protein